MRRNKKAQMQSFVIFIVSLILIATTLLIAKVVYDKVGEGLNTEEISTTESVTAYNSFAVSFEIFDTAMIFIILGLTIGLVITSFFIPVHPIFMIVNIIGMVFLAFMGAIMANIYGSIVDVEDVQDTINSVDPMTGEPKTYFEKTSFLMSKLAWICLAIVALITVLMYAKGSLP